MISEFTACWLVCGFPLQTQSTFCPVFKDLRFLCGNLPVFAFSNITDMRNLLYVKPNGSQNSSEGLVSSMSYFEYVEVETTT